MIPNDSPSSATAKRRQLRVLVVGGGLAGITAALDCAEMGAEVTVLERKAHLGGATYSFARKGLNFDNGQHVFLGCCTHYIRLLDRLGVRGLTQLQERLQFPVLSPTAPPMMLRRGRLPSPLHLLPMLARYKRMSLTKRLKAARAIAKLGKIELGGANATAEETTFGQWIDSQGFNGPQLEELWDLLLKATCNLDARDCSLSTVAQVVQTGLLGSVKAADIGWANVSLGQLHDLPARSVLRDAGVSVLCEARVLKVARIDSGSELEVQWKPTREQALSPDSQGDFQHTENHNAKHQAEHETGSDSRHSSKCAINTHGAKATDPTLRTYHVDAVVLAVPHQEASHIAPVAFPKDLSDALGSSPIVNVQLHFDRKVADIDIAAVLDSPLQWIFDRSRAVGASSGQCIGVSMSAADSWLNISPGDIVNSITNELGKIFPKVASAVLLDSVVTKERAATFRAEKCSAANRPSPRTPIPGVYLAGAWTNTGWPATMEGAVRSGSSASAAVFASFLAASDLAKVHT